MYLHPRASAIDAIELYPSKSTCLVTAVAIASFSRGPLHIFSQSSPLRMVPTHAELFFHSL